MKHYTYPESDKITICKTDLKHRFKEYYDAVSNKFTFFDLLIIVPAWASIASLNFPDLTISGVRIASGLTAKGVAIGLLTMGTIPKIIGSISYYWTKSGGVHKHEHDPERKVEAIFSDCSEVNRRNNIKEI